MRQSTLYEHEFDGHVCPVCDENCNNENHVRSHFGYSHPDKHLTAERIRAEYDTDPAALLRKLHQIEELPVYKIAERTGFGRTGITRAMEHYGIDRDTTRGAEALRQWRADNPGKAKEHATRAAAMGTPARETNGMAGVTGQDHHLWRGGKSIYDAVKLSLGRESWDSTRERIRADGDNECFGCGTILDERGLDVHHIVPIMAGGCNNDELLMSLCPDCHHKAEAYTRAVPEIQSVLVE